MRDRGPLSRQTDGAEGALHPELLNRIGSAAIEAPAISTATSTAASSTKAPLYCFQTSSYRSGTTPGEVRIRKDVDIAIRGKHVLIIEDIVDTGHTLNTVLGLFRFRGAKSVKLCALLDKYKAREVTVNVDYSGFKIDNVFVVGYGLDFDECYRELPYIGIYEPDGDQPSE